jgi:lysyl endopeptidase
MKKILFRIIGLLLIIANNSNAQVSTNFNNDNTISSKGRFNRNYAAAIDFIIEAKNIDSLLKKEKQEIEQSNELKPFKLATPTNVNLDIPKQIAWTYDNEFAYGKFTIKLLGALSSSITFDKFYLPKNTELFVYNENGSMITGPVTEKENNKNGIWGSWVYQGDILTIEIRTPITSINELQLHSDNIAYGYKQVYKSIKVGGFGTSGPCNINVICPLGNGWEAERNSVSTILSATGGEFCTGSLIMNTCGTNTPYYLTANHCFNPNPDVTGWRFAFQAWSTTCPNPGVNTNGVMYNGATLRARNAATDFCLVELNNTPPANSGLHYAGWNRSSTPAQNATGIHHPSGDLMKISRANNPVSIGSFAGTTNQHWRSDWSVQNNGAGQNVTAITEPGSSGSPLFDQNRRIIGQLHGGPSLCTSTQQWDFYGRFDLSWTGGGTNDTRLSNWLDPTNTNATTTNTTNVASLGASGPPTSNPIGYFTTNPQPTTGGSGSTQTPLANDTYQSFYVPRNSYVSMNFVVTSATFPSYNWSQSNSTSVATGLNYSSSIQASPYGYSSVTRTIYLDYGTICGTARKAYTFNVVSIGGFGRVAVNPNPAKDVLNVSIIKDDKILNEINSKQKTKALPTSQTLFSLTDIFTNQVIKRWIFNEKQLTTYNLNISGLKKGVYVLTTERDGEKSTTKVIIQ